MLPWRQAFGTQCFCLPDMWFYMLNCFSRVWFFGIPWAVAHQAPLSMGFSRQEHWSGLPFPSPGNLPNPGIKPASLRAPALAGEFSTTRATWVADESGRSELCIPSSCEEYTLLSFFPVELSFTHEECWWSEYPRGYRVMRWRFCTSVRRRCLRWEAVWCKIWVTEQQCVWKRKYEHNNFIGEEKKWTKEQKWTKKPKMTRKGNDTSINPEVEDLHDGLSSVPEGCDREWGA